MPCIKTVTAVKLLDQKLGLFYRRKTKEQPAELFIRKTNEADTLPEFQAVVQSLDSIRDTIDDNLSKLEEAFSNFGTFQIRSEKNSTAAEKEVCVWRITLAQSYLTRL